MLRPRHGAGNRAPEIASCPPRRDAAMTFGNDMRQLQAATTGGNNGGSGRRSRIARFCRLLTIYTHRRYIGKMLKSPASSPRSVRTPPGPAAVRSDRRSPAVHRNGADTIALVQSSSLPGLVQKELERMILAGDLPAGGKLNEASVAELLGVSRGPVREAFRALEASGLVRLEKNRGVFVRQISVDEADEIYEVRAALDEFVGRRLAQTASADDVRDLRSRIERMERAAAKGDVDTYAAANLDFHDRLVELAGNAKLLATYRRLVNELNLYRRATLAQTGRCRSQPGSIARSSTGLPPGTPPRPAARCSST